jgi:hypothetical protein
MATNPCIAEASQALGRELTDDEAITLFEDVQKRVREAENASGPYDEAIRRSKERMILEKKTAAFIEKRNAYIQFKLRNEAVDFIKTQFPDNPALGIEALLVGVNKAKMGSRFSAAAISKTLFNKYAGGLVTELQTRNLNSILTSGDFDRELYRALFAVNRKEELPYNGSKEVLETSRIIKKYFELMRHDYNVSGANIDMLEGYMGRQSHDSGRIEKAGLEAWIDFILPKLDIDRTFEGEKPREVLAKIYNNFISGIHLKTSENVTGFKGGTANLGKKASQDRVLHFKDADSWYEYNQQFGTGSLSETIIRQMSVTSQNVGLMRVFGPNPKDNFNRITGMILNTLDGKAKGDFDNAVKGFLSNRFAEVDGTTRVPINDLMSQVSSGVRAIQTMADLGGALLASVTDLAAIMTELRYQGFDMFDGLTESLAGLAKGRSAEELAEIDAAIGVIFPSLIGEMHSRFISQDGAPGAISKGMQLFFKLNGMSYWTEVLKATVSRTMSHMAAINKGKTFDELNPDTRRVYSLYGIDSDKWDMFRQTGKIGADGKEYLLPNKIADLPDQVFADYLTKRNVKPSDTAIAELKREVETQWRTYFTDRAEYAVLEPDARTQSIMNQGHQPGTVLGEVLKFVGQYKSFPIAFVQKVLGREIYGRGSDTLGQALRNGNGEMTGLMQVMVWSTIFGYGAMNAKAILAGKEPRKPEDARGYLELVKAAMLQGGGAGIYGDFLFGEMKSRYGAGPLETFLGPTFSNLSSLADLYGRAMKGDDVAGSAVKFVINNTPGNNIWWAKTALDYGVIYRLQEGLNPGYLKRMEQRIKKEQDQSFIFPPSQVIR